MAYRTLEECEKDFIENLRHGGAVGVMEGFKMCDTCKLCKNYYCNYFNVKTGDIENKKLTKVIFDFSDTEKKGRCPHYVRKSRENTTLSEEGYKKCIL
jgi:hypothetical protein